MIENIDGRLLVRSPMLMDISRALLEAGREAMAQGENVFDLSEVTEADSSAVAVMLGWLRSAESLRSTVKFAQIPSGVRSLAELYGVSDLLPLV
jgi:phospholipid transport system transporter-binding protein